MGSLETNNIEIVENHIPVEWFIKFLKSAVKQEISQSTFDNIKQQYNTMEYDEFVEKYFSTFGKYISCYTEEYQNLFLNYIEKNILKSSISENDIFTNISQKILEIIDETSKYRWEKMSLEVKKIIIDKINNLLKLYEQLDKKNTFSERKKEILSIKKYISWRNYPSKNTAELFLEKLEEYENEIKKTV